MLEQQKLAHDATLARKLEKMQKKEEQIRHECKGDEKEVRRRLNKLYNIETSARGSSLSRVSESRAGQSQMFLNRKNSVQFISQKSSIGENTIESERS
jgi:hypothetical protein